MLGAVIAIPSVPAAMAAEPVKLALQLPLKGKKFSAYSMEFSPNSERACMAGTDYDEMGDSTGRLMLLDLAHPNVAWQKTVAPPDGFAKLIPVQCLVTTDRVYLLANVDTSASPPQAHTFAYVFAFDVYGKQLATTQVKVAGSNKYSYAMAETAGGISVVGYSQDGDAGSERYATYTVTLDAALQQSGAALVRKNGAYTGQIGARIVGDSVYLSGRFYGATASKEDLGKSAASRLRMAGGYAWSTPTGLKEGADVYLGAGGDGTSYAVSYDNTGTTLHRVTPDGKALPGMTFSSVYCETESLASYGNSVLAVRDRCAGKGSALMAIDVNTGKEKVVSSLPGEPLFVATKGSGWATVLRDKQGRLSLYFALSGGL